MKSCMPVSVERSDKDKDADENVDADQISTGPVKSGQSIGLFTQREEIDIDFRVSGLSHAVVKQAENISVRELVKKIGGTTLTEKIFNEIYNKNNAYNPFSEKSQKMIREMGNVELFELCETIPKVQCSECLLYWNQGVIYCTCGQILIESEPSHIFRQWQLECSLHPALRHQKGSDLVVLGTAKLRHRNSIS